VSTRGTVAVNVGETRVLAFPRKMVEQIILGLAYRLNRRLVALTVFELPIETRQRFRREIKRWLDELQSLRFKGNGQTGSFKFYFNPLFDYPFGRVEVQNMRAMLKLLSEDYDLAPTSQPGEMVKWLREFHRELAERLHNGEDVLDLIPE
jgi:hypothetical protein